MVGAASVALIVVLLTLVIRSPSCAPGAPGVVEPVGFGEVPLALGKLVKLSVALFGIVWLTGTVFVMRAVSVMMPDAPGYN